jgi:putative ABC transport system permease protein
MPPAAKRRPLLFVAPWRRAPLLLRRAPGVLAAVAGAGFLLTLAVASRPMFLGSAGAAAVDSDLRDGCRYTVGFRLQAGRVFRASEPDQADPASIAPRTKLLAAASKSKATSLQPTVVTVTGGNGEIVSPTGERGQGVVQLFSRTGATSPKNIEVTQPPLTPTAKGIWIPDTTAELLHVGPGSKVDVRLGDVLLPATVAAVFRDLTYVERPKFWCSMERSFEPLGSNPLPPVALMEQQELLDLLAAGDHRPPFVTWELPPADGLSLPRAEALSKSLSRIDQDLRGPTRFAEEFGVDDGLTLHIGLPSTVDHAHLVTRQVRTTADTVGTAGTAIALVAVAAAGFFWVDRRRNEVALLLAKGVGPVGLATKAALEALLPVTVGAAAGTVAAIAAVRAFGPSSAFDARATAEAVRLAAFASVAGLVLLATAAGIRVRRAELRMAGVPHHAKGAVPIALTLLTAGAVAAGVAIEQAVGYTQLGSGRKGASLGLVVVVFPLLVLSGGGGLAALVGHWLLPRTRRMGRRWPMAPYLALRRVATAGPLALALTAGSVLSVGILLYATVVADSARATVVAKATIGVGSDMAVFLVGDDIPKVPDDIARRSTPVLRSAGTALTDDEEGEQPHVGLLGIDRATFARGAFYDRTFAGGRSLAKLLDSLDAHPTNPNAVNVIAADAAAVPDAFDLDTGSGEPIPIRVVTRAQAFPGMSGEQPLLISDEAVLKAHGILGNRQLWVRGSTSSVLAQLDRAHVPVVTTTIAKTNQAASSLLPLATSLGYFKALGLLGGTVTLCGAVFYLGSRERARRLAGVMTRGMGLTRRAARAALALELGGLLLLGLLLGEALSSWAARVTFPHLDPSPGTPPRLIFRWDMRTALQAAAVTLVSAAVLAVLSERASSRRLAAEVMRDA